jgi:hypothetical protein
MESSTTAEGEILCYDWLEAARKVSLKSYGTVIARRFKIDTHSTEPGLGGKAQRCVSLLTKSLFRFGQPNG